MLLTVLRRGKDPFPIGKTAKATAKNKELIEDAVKETKLAIAYAFFTRHKVIILMNNI